MQPGVPHSVFIAASYAVVALVVAALIAWVILDGRRLARDLARLEAQGIRRRSSRIGTGEGESS
ncbi:MAG: heme exporter protein CcmD [Hyphomicrobiaceae bacterium]